ncbi:hypothetical protein [Jonesia quinghaiensis]|uniref:hypothetical protein n=1 Tax=Jonesia quinghaiensis TaxID=262806 RepID=UPI0004070FA2|nr:hypothetical protein [Jonesia quinghaiensis]
MRHTQTAGLALTGIMALALTGCASTLTLTESGSMTTTDYSRVALYDSLDAMSADSDLVVVGIVGTQTTVYDIDDITPFTLSTVTIQDAVLGEAPADAITVRQFGDVSIADTEEILTPGTTYLLYLTESGLSGELAAHYYVTGVTAGIYQAKTAQRSPSRISPQTLSQNTLNSLTFEHISTEDGDELPSNVTLDTAESADAPPTSDR